ncbi:YfhO family protein [Patescibacteria group bacterium]
MSNKQIGNSLISSNSIKAQGPISLNSRKNKRTLLFILLILICALPAIRSLLYPGFFPSMDGHLHVYRSIELKKALVEGHFPVRWGANYAQGFGLPIYNFYSPLFFYLVGAFSWLSLTFLGATKLVLILNIVLAGIFMFLLARQLWGNWGGAVSSILYIYTPYLFVNIYVRGAFPEALTFALIPLVFWSFYQLSQTKKSRYFFLSGLALALLPLAHNFLSMVTAPFLGLFLLILYRQSKQKIIFLPAILGLISSAFFWLPVLLEKKYLLPSVFTENYDFRDSFLYLKQLFYSPWGFEGNVKGPDDGMSFMIGFPLIFLILLGLLAKHRLKKQASKLLIFFLGSFCLAVLMTLGVSRFIWELIPLLHVAQFPWRFLVLVVFFASLIAGASLKLVKKNSRPLASLIIIGLTLALNYSFARPKEITLNLEDRHYSGHHLGIPRAPVIGDDFSPRWVKTLPDKPAQNQIDPNEVIQNPNFSSHRYSFNTNLSQETDLKINTLYFPGWQAWIDDQITEVKITENGLMEIEVPAGDHQVKIEFKETALRKTANWISMGSLIMLLTLTLSLRFFNRREV